MDSGRDVRTPDTLLSDDTYHGTDDRYYIIPLVLLVYRVYIPFVVMIYILLMMV